MIPVHVTPAVCFARVRLTLTIATPARPASCLHEAESRSRLADS